MVPPGPGVSLPHLGVPGLIPAVLSPPTPPARRFLPPIVSGPFPSQGAVGPGQPPQHTHPRAQGRDKDPGHLPAMAGQGDTQLGDCEQTSPGVTLTENLIATRNLPHLVEPLHPQSRSMEPLTPSTIRLDRENICAIGRLQSLREIHSLYLQQNQIEKIENLGCFPNLRFLSLAGNRIRRVENLQPLRHLRFLDLSHNRIQMLDPDELPRSLRLLDLTGNECTHQHGYSWTPSPSAAAWARMRRTEAFPAVRMKTTSCSLSQAALSLQAKISLRICSGSWLSARSGGGGSAWRNTGPVWKSWRSCGSVRVCCCLPHR
ncbi:leucine-rich repeat-containing protein 46 isoform 3-T3 [Pluvialis apricaria]